MKRAVIVGSGGQDGKILYERLQRAGYMLLGIESRGIRTNTEFSLGFIDITQRQCVMDLVHEWRPDEIYYLAAFHHSSQDVPQDDAMLFEKSYSIHVSGVVNFLQSIKDAALPTRLFYAASSLVFGATAPSPQNENTPLNPDSVYGITKAGGVHCCRLYRHAHGIHAAVGYLYNHESPLRQAKFVSQKIVQGAIAIRQGRMEKLVLGDLSARIDWGYAPDYVEAMVRTLSLPEPGDFVIATGESHSVREFVEIAFSHMGLDWKKCVEENPDLLKRRNAPLIGDASKLKALTGWSPTVNFKKMVEILMTEGANTATP